MNMVPVAAEMRRGVSARIVTLPLDGMETVMSPLPVASARATSSHPNICENAG